MRGFSIHTQRATWAASFDATGGARQSLRQPLCQPMRNARQACSRFVREMSCELFRELVRLEARYRRAS